jgi:hypothetical protein
MIGLRDSLVVVMDQRKEEEQEKAGLVTFLQDLMR